MYVEEEAPTMNVTVTIPQPRSTTMTKKSTRESGARGAFYTIKTQDSCGNVVDRYQSELNEPLSEHSSDVDADVDSSNDSYVDYATKRDNNGRNDSAFSRELSLPSTKSSRPSTAKY
jgi:hypothetical protein